MHACARRSVTAVLGVCIVMAVGPTACGSSPDDPVHAGPAPEAAPSAAGGGSTPSSSEAPADPAPSSTGPSSTEPASTVPPAPEPAPSGAPSPAEGLTASELRSVVEAPPAAGPTGRRARGPVADQVPVGGRPVWRITVPGRFEVLSARIVVAVGGRDVGVGVVAPDLESLVAVVADPAALVAGAPVTYRWGAGEPVAAGVLEVVR